MHTRCLLGVAALSALAATDLRAVQPPPPRPCDQYETVLRTEPNNVDAAVSLGRCTLRDAELSAPGAESTPLAFRTSWTPALRALRRAIAADPTNARAYGLLFRMLFAETRDACSRLTGQCLHVAPVLRSGDSLLTPPRLVERRPPPDTTDTYDEVVAESRATEHASLVEARSLAERWLARAPDDRRPHEYLGRALLLLGDSVAASNALERAAELGTPQSRRALFWYRLTALVKANRGIEARHVLEEAASDPGGDTSQLRARSIATMHAVLGRHRPMQIDPAKRRADSIRFAEIRRRLRPDPSTFRPVPPLPSFDSLIAVGDTAGARRVAARIDSMNAVPPGTRRIPSVGQEMLHSARMQLALHDTARAEERLASITGLLDQRRFEHNSALVLGDPRPWMGHAWALSGDIAAARGRTDDAARMYRRVIGLWEGGDLETQPVVEHARARLAALHRR